MASTLQITDGTTTVDFTGSTYKVLSEEWAPMVTRRRVSQLGGAGPYEEVRETMGINIVGANAAAVLSALSTLRNLLDQARRWSLGEQVAPVKISYQPTGSALGAALQAVILDGGLQLPNTFDNEPFRTQLGTRGDPIILSFVRRGLWLGATEAETVAAATTYNPGKWTATFASDPDVPSPTKVQIDGESYGTSSTGYIFFADAADKILVVEGEGYTNKTEPGAGTIASHADAAASDGNTAMFTPNAAGDYVVEYVTAAFSTYNSDATRHALFAVLRNNSSTVVWDIDAQLARRDSNIVTVGADNNNPQALSFGVFTTPTGANLSLRVTATPQTTGGAGNELEIDYWILFAVDDVTSQAVHVAGLETAASVLEITLDHRLLTEVSPLASIDVLPTTFDVRGSAYINSIGTSFSAFAMLVSDEYWYMYDDFSTAQAEIGFTATRYEGYLTPQ